MPTAQVDDETLIKRLTEAGIYYFDVNTLLSEEFGCLKCRLHHVAICQHSTICAFPDDLGLAKFNRLFCAVVTNELVGLWRVASTCALSTLPKLINNAALCIWRPEL